MVAPKANDHIQIKIKIPNLNHHPPVFSKALNQDLKDMNVLCTFKTKIGSQNLEHGCTIVPKTSDPFSIKIKILNPSQDPLAFLKASNQDFKDMDILGAFKIKIEGKKLEHGSTKDQWPYPNQYQDDESQSWTSSVLQRPKSGL